MTTHYCIHCERTFEGPEDRFEAGVYNVERGGQTCPYDGCDGTPLDFWNYHEDVREPRSEEERKHFPEAPEEGKRYPLYPVKEDECPSST